ncbi:MAG: GyrI-like domain-containing protein [Methanobacterium sp.]|nr:GyrI-like domain-containing protein [Methanobacterium sp.]
MEINQKKTEEKHVAYIFYRGYVEDMGKLIGEIVDWMIDQDVKMSGPPYSVYYTSPKEVLPNDMQYELGIPFKGEASELGKIKIKDIPAQEVIYALNKGPYNKIGAVYESLMNKIIEEGFQMVGAPIEIYFNSPMEVSEDELLTEVQFPIVKV